MFVLNANNAKPLPKLLNQDGFYKTAYPKQGFVWYNASPIQVSKVGLVNMTQNISYWIADNTITETIWSTQINGLFRNLIDAFLNIGNFYTTSWDYWTATDMRVGWLSWYNQVTNGTYTFSITARFASAETLLANKNVGAQIILAPAIRFVNGWGAQNLNINWSSVQASYTFKLMSSNWTLTTIWTITTDSIDTINTPFNSTKDILQGVKTWNFTPITSQEGDRIVVEITLSWSAAVTWSGWGSTSTSYAAVGFGYVWSNRQVASDYFAARPFQVSIT